MLQTIRDHAQGWIAWVIVGLIILTFALFGIDQYARGDKLVTVAEVNGEDITATSFLTLYNRQKVRLQEQFGDLYDQVVKDEELRNQVLDALIESEVIRQWSRDSNMTISDQQLAATIHGAEVFHQDGTFSDKVYEEILMRNGLNVARFEYEQRQYLLEAQYRELTNGSNFTTAFELNQLANLQGQQRDVSYLRVDQRPFLTTVQVTDEQIAQHYEAQKALYVEAEKVAIDYIELSQATIAESVAVSDEIITNYYNENQSAFTQPEKRQAKHILIAVDANNPESEAAASVVLAEVQAKLKAGDSFETLAQTYSKDPGSASLGGDLGSFEQGMMVPAFDEAVFSMDVNQVSEPVQTEFGYHLIKLMAIEPPKVQALADIKVDVTAQYQMQQAEKQYFEMLEKLNVLAYEQPDSLEPAAQAVGLSVITSENLAGRVAPVMCCLIQKWLI
ncbi:SurA N-terminal domain-containing protein [Thiomicrorhabdus aquaedulcis]|uniref:SurA N-terminal domain-containing protein n=1 Tax=Thiomicrorhabdus aquaedulcis TaxID=2211106 RepID=UPI001E500C9A|nr:SurA N-terminal domain-containing protein [Thiomicrorhabdus aquaedulcis]